MLIDPQDLSGDEITADVCIIGAGAAGITIARALRGTPLDVLLVEGGGLKATGRSQELYEGFFDTTGGGKPEPENYLRTSRLRYLGGATNHWAGWCRPLESHDFEVRDWVPHSGWPISYADLQPWYDAAIDVLQIPAFEPDHGAGRTKRKPLSWRPTADLQTRIFHFSAPVRFGTAYRADLVEATNVRLLLEANLLRFRADPQARTIDHAELKIEDGPAMRIRARAFVLATGGVENARVLLLSDREAPAGLGNDRDLVGRFFLDHPHAKDIGRLASQRHPQSKGHLALYTKRRKDKTGTKTRGVLNATPEAQRRHGLLNASMTVGSDSIASSRKTDVAVGELLDVVGRAPGKVADFRSVYIRSEQAPNPDSRVTLTEETDRLGLRRAALDWRLTEADALSMRGTMGVLARELGIEGLGRARTRKRTEKLWPRMPGGKHHLGTTRMSEDPTTGVVDPHCRVHGVSNLWVGGSSVFPTGGFANPTMTIVALALRLADRLRSELTG